MRFWFPFMLPPAEQFEHFAFREAVNSYHHPGGDANASALVRDFSICVDKSRAL